MDPTSLLKPRLRLHRRTPSPRGDPTPALFDDDESDEAPTPRIHPRPIVVDPSAAETPAARLRALLAREPRSPAPPAPPSDADSARFGSSTSSVARDSLKDIFSRALREPGDTPKKDRPRRNSFDGSSMEITPVVDKDRRQRRVVRKSLSDEEAEKPKSNGRVDPSFRLSTALTFDALRARLVSSRSQLINQNPPDALYDPSTSASGSENQPLPSTSTRVNAQANPLTPYPSLQMSSQLALQSNLLEQDSEMQRAMRDVLDSENEAPNATRSTTIPSDSHPASSIRGSLNDTQRRTSYEPDPSAARSVDNAREREHFFPQQEGHDHQRERDWNRPRVPPRTSTPDVHHRHSQESHRRLSQEFRSPSHIKSLSHGSAISQNSTARPVHRHLERRSSLVSLRNFDDDHSSRPSSVGSQADYRDRISELEREKFHEREREWNKRHPPSRPSSSLSASSNHSFSLSPSHPPRSPSALAYLTPTHASLQRKSSHTSLRSDSPASLSSSRESFKEQEQEEKKEVIHERERNWNSPRPHWSASKSPTHLQVRNKDNNSLRTSSSLPHLRSSRGHGDASRGSTKLQISLPKVDVSTTSPGLLHKSGGRSDSEASSVGTTQSPRLNDLSPGKSPGTTSKFGWNFARNPLPPLDLNDAADHRRSTLSPTPDYRRSSRTSEAIVSSHIPVRSRRKSFSSAGHGPSDMSLTNVICDESSDQDYENRLSDIVEPQSHEEHPAARSSWSQEDMALGCEEESMVGVPQSTTPKSNPPKSIPEEIETDTETEVLTSPSPQGSPQPDPSLSFPSEAPRKKFDELTHVQTLDRSADEPPASRTPPGTPPSSPSSQLKLPAFEDSPSFSLVTPPRATSFGSSILDFRTPSPPRDLPDLPGPPSSSDDDVLAGSPTKDRHVDANLNSTLVKTPKPPGAWAATPLPPKLGHRSSSPATPFPLESTPPAFTSTPLPRANTLPPTHNDATSDDPGEDELLTPLATLSRARSLPLRTPVPPGGWVATPGQSVLVNNGVDQSQYGSIGRRKGLLKVRFDVAESETSATEGHPNSPLTAIRLTNPELPLPNTSTDHPTDSSAKVVLIDVTQSSSTSSVPHRPATPERPTTPTSRENGPSPRSLRKSPSVRVVDAYGRKRADEEVTSNPLIYLPSDRADAERKISSPSTPRRSLVRIVDAMGKEVDDTVAISNTSEDRANRSIEADISVVPADTPIGHAEALARMRKTLRDLAEGLSDADRSEDLELNSSHLEQLEEVSKVARLARNQLAHNLHLETAREHDRHHDGKSSSAPELLPATVRKSWNPIIIYCGVIAQLLVIFVMWRYAHAEARRLFYTTYYDPLYPELTPIQESSCFSGTISTSRPWTMLDSYETIRREGWQSIRRETLRWMRHVGDQAWEQWGENAHFEKPT